MMKDLKSFHMGKKTKETGKNSPEETKLKD
jgi:hypothetical protein